MSEAYLDALTQEQLDMVVSWRNENRAALRTPGYTSRSQQRAFYERLLGDDARNRYWAVKLRKNGAMVALVGLTNIEWENGLAEISLITSNALNEVKQGNGRRSVELVLAEAFERMRLVTVFGECYACNGEALGFWNQMIDIFRGIGMIALPRRKMWDGVLHDGWYFTFTAEGYMSWKRGEQ